MRGQGQGERRERGSAPLGEGGRGKGRTSRVLEEGVEWGFLYYDLPGSESAVGKAELRLERSARMESCRWCMEEGARQRAVPGDGGKKDLLEDFFEDLRRRVQDPRY